MNFTLIRAEFDHVTDRAYAELRADDDDGGEGIVTAILTYRNKSPLSKHEVKRDIVRKARHMFKRAAVVT